MKTLDEVSRELLAEMKELRQSVEMLREEAALPGACSYERAARYWDTSLATVKRMVATGEVHTVLVHKTPKIPASELRRIATLHSMKSAVVPKQQQPKKSAMSEAEKIRARNASRRR